MNIVTKLSDNLLPKLKAADELWIAVGMINLDGLLFLLRNTPTNCTRNFLLGVDLPTDPNALGKLNELQLKSNLNVRLFTESEFYHPKIYLKRSSNTFSGFIGSANCTNGGLNKNIELTIQVDDQTICTHLKSWFDSVFDRAKPLTSSFVKTYRAHYSERRRRKSEDEQAARDEKKAFTQKLEITLKQKNAFIRILRGYRQRHDYEDIRLKRQKSISELRSSLDYPHFDNVDVDLFFSIWELGHIIALPKPTIRREITKFSKLLRVLCDERMDVAQRYERVLAGDLRIRGVNKGLVSKILAIHNPTEYFVKNAKSEGALRKYGIELPRGLSRGEKYKITCRFLKEICTETSIENLAVLDYYLYLEGQNAARPT